MDLAANKSGNYSEQNPGQAHKIATNWLIALSPNLQKHMHAGQNFYVYGEGEKLVPDTSGSGLSSGSTWVRHIELQHAQSFFRQI